MNLISSFNENKSAYIASFIIILIVLYGWSRYFNVQKNGVITICRVDEYKPDADGSSTYCTIFLNNAEYHVISGAGSKTMVGKYYFVKVLKKDPNYETIIYNEVPVCISKSDLPPGGWDTIPTCK